VLRYVAAFLVFCSLMELASLDCLVVVEYVAACFADLRLITLVQQSCLLGHPHP
jgi:hypothetical protein